MPSDLFLIILQWTLFSGPLWRVRARPPSSCRCGTKFLPWTSVCAWEGRPGPCRLCQGPLLRNQQHCPLSICKPFRSQIVTSRHQTGTCHPSRKGKEEVSRATFSLAWSLQLPLFLPLGAFIYELEHVPLAGRRVLRASSPCPRPPAEGRSAKSQARERQS